MTTYNDSDLREALRRRYAQEPQVPAGFTDRLMKRIDRQEPAASPAGRRWRWVAAASVVIASGIGAALLTLQPAADVTARGEERRMRKADKVLADAVKPVETASHTARQESKEPYDAASGTGADEADDAAAVHVAPMPRRMLQPMQPTVMDRLPEAVESATDAVAHVRYASLETSADTVSYQDPARVNEFIEKFADYCHVRQGELESSVPADSGVVSKVYVFPDEKEIDVFGRLLQVACWYSDETPGYLLNFSHPQLYFELKDPRRQLQYCWIAERISGKILLYSTCSPIGTVVSSVRYQKYRDELMHANKINTKTF